MQCRLSRMLISLLGTLLVILVSSLGGQLSLTTRADAQGDISPSIYMASYDRSSGLSATVGRNQIIPAGSMIVWFVADNLSSTAPTPISGPGQILRRGETYSLTNGTITWYVTEYWSFASQGGTGWRFSISSPALIQDEFYILTNALGFDSRSVSSNPASISGTHRGELIMANAMFMPNTGQCPNGPATQNGFQLDTNLCFSRSGQSGGMLQSSESEIASAQGQTSVGFSWAVKGASIVIADSMMS
ncbi:MAG TPA: hypothetical protein VE955_04485 [Candidatus Dormibacteraeota bacterium]|nr:hypothetical protein [Candidatus Dormibacteraeota bacterium]